MYDKNQSMSTTVHTTIDLPNQIDNTAKIESKILPVVTCNMYCRKLLLVSYLVIVSV